MKLRLIRFQLPLVATLAAVALAFSPHTSAEEKPAPQADSKAGLEEALKKLKLPGVEVNLKERCVDVASAVCLREGLLELIACTKDTKEHEAIIRIEAVPKHVHAALLLIGARPGSPAMRKPADKEETQWIYIPPSGGPVDVSLVIPDKEGKMIERPIADFIVAIDHEPGVAGEDAKVKRFPTSTFIFAGSILDGEKDGPRQYVADSSGNVISITTFGDELLCLPDFQDNANTSLMWQVDSTHLPPLGAKVTLRLRPQAQDKPSAPAKE